jgi:hypothetical protein
MHQLAFVFAICALVIGYVSAGASLAQILGRPAWLAKLRMPRSSALGMIQFALWETLAFVPWLAGAPSNVRLVLNLIGIIPLVSAVRLFAMTRSRDQPGK